MFEACDFSSEFPFHVEMPATFIVSTMTALGWRSEPWLEKIVNQYWLGLNAEHGIIRNHIAHILQFSNLMKVSVFFIFENDLSDIFDSGELISQYPLWKISSKNVKCL